MICKTACEIEWLILYINNVFYPGRQTFIIFNTVTTSPQRPLYKFFKKDFFYLLASKIPTRHFTPTGHSDCVKVNR